MKPILFNSEMVRAILAGDKTQTRRVVAPSYKDDEYGFAVCTNQSTGEQWIEKTNDDEGTFDNSRYVKPKYYTGDILYVRETWQKYNDKDGNSCVAYKADSNHELHLGKWKPSIHMPKELSRIYLEVLSVKPQKIQDMELVDFGAEGIPLVSNGIPREFLDVSNDFAKLWDSTVSNKEKHSFASNPWVWVYSFKLTTKKERD